jgi:hypothetical protein
MQCEDAPLPVLNLALYGGEMSHSHSADLTHYLYNKRLVEINCMFRREKCQWLELEAVPIIQSTILSGLLTNVLITT